MSVIGRKVHTLRLIRSIHLLGLGNIASVIDPNVTGKLGQCTLELVTEGVLISYKSKGTEKGIQALIPYANILSAELE